MAAAGALADRVHVACALGTSSEHSSKHASISEKQKVALMHMLEGTELQSSVVSTLLQKLASAPWVPEHFAELVDKVQDCIATAVRVPEQTTSSHEVNNQGQDFTSFLHSLTSSQWERLQEIASMDDPLTACQEELCACLENLRLRNPSELTCRSYATIALFLVEGFGVASKKARAELNPIYKMFKKQLKTRLKGSHSLQVLPPTPDLLRRSHKPINV